jgi:hypothetical protein
MSKVIPPTRTGFSRCPEHQRGPLLSCSPCESALPNNSACEVSVEAAGPKQSVVAAQRSRRGGGVLRGRPRLGGVGEEHLAGIGRPMGRSQGQAEVADDRVADELDAGALDLDVGRPPYTNSSLRVDSSTSRTSPPSTVGRSSRSPGLRRRTSSSRWTPRTTPNRVGASPAPPSDPTSCSKSLTGWSST